MAAAVRKREETADASDVLPGTVLGSSRPWRFQGVTARSCSPQPSPRLSFYSFHVQAQIVKKKKITWKCLSNGRPLMRSTFWFYKWTEPRGSRFCSILVRVGEHVCSRESVTPEPPGLPFSAMCAGGQHFQRCMRATMGVRWPGRPLLTGL